MAVELKAVADHQGHRFVVFVQPQRQFAFEHVAALLRAVAQVPLATAGTGFQAAFKHGERGPDFR
ncbi:hypothetical protein D3C71_1880610 [compost metagenome]